MFSQVCKDGRLSKSVAIGAISAVLVMACAGQAMAADRGGRGGGGSSHNNMNKQVYGGRSHGHNNNGHHGGHGHNGGHGHSNSSFSLSIGVGSYGSGWSSSYGYSSGYGAGCGTGYGYGWRGPAYYRPAVCAPVVIAPACPPVVVVRDPYYAPVTRTIVVSEPVVVERPVYVERQVVVERPVTVERPVVVEKQVIVERVVERPAPAPTAPVAPQAGTYRDRELGDAYLRIGDMGNAARVYGRYLTAWEKDGTATRNMGLAQIATGHPQEGFRNFVTGHKLEPTLIDRPLSVDDVGGAAGYTALLDQAARSADGLNTPDAWVTVALLQHMNGQRDAAVAALGKARIAGLDADTLDVFTLKIAG